jgi:hypothetical protein
MIVSAGPKGLRFADEVSLNHQKTTTTRVEIEASPGRDGISEDKINAVLSKMFLTPQDQIAESVPDYWKRCLREGVSGKNEHCLFSVEIAAVPGALPPSQSPGATDRAVTSPPSADANAKGVEVMYRVGDGVRPPRAIYQPEPASATRRERRSIRGR